MFKYVIQNLGLTGTQYSALTGDFTGQFQLSLSVVGSNLVVPIKAYSSLANAKTGAGAFTNATVASGLTWTDTAGANTSVSSVFSPA